MFYYHNIYLFFKLLLDNYIYIYIYVIFDGDGIFFFVVNKRFPDPNTCYCILSVKDIQKNQAHSPWALNAIFSYASNINYLTSNNIKIS